MQFTLADLDLPVRVRFTQPLSDEQLLCFCSENKALRIERDAGGELTVMAPSGTGMGRADLEIGAQLLSWARRTNSGVAFGASAGFRLPDGSMRSPDASFVSWSRWNGLTREEQQHGFAPIGPEFVIELRSPSDRLSDLQRKMGEWLRNGAALAWLIDPERRVVEVCRPDAQPEVVEGAMAVQGEGPVTGFALDLIHVWEV